MKKRLLNALLLLAFLVILPGYEFVIAGFHPVGLVVWYGLLALAWVLHYSAGRRKNDNVI